MYQPRPPSKDDAVELDIGHVVMRILDGLFFFIINIVLYIFICWVLHQVEDVSFDMEDRWLKTGAILMSSFLTGVVVGLKISQQKGGLLALSLAILAMLGFSYTMNHELPVAEPFLRMIPLLSASAPPYVPYLVPVAGFLGILLYRFFTVSTD